MNPRVLIAALVLTFGACAFNPDLSRFDECGPEGSCPAGFLCLTEENRCVPECGENCAPPSDAGSDAGFDAGVDAGFDAGFDAGVDAGEDAGMDASVDAGMDGGQDDAGPALRLAGMTLPAAIETKAYQVDFVPTGGQGNYLFSIDGGIPGFVLSTGGRLSTSMAPTPGTFPFSITVQDQAVPPAVVTTSYSLQVRPLLRVANHELVEGRSGQSYFQQLSATGGQPPYRWFVDGGMPPAGISLNGDAGVLQGAPNNAATVMFNVTVVDSATPPQLASGTLTIKTVLLDVLVAAIATPAAADGRVGTPYNQPLKAYPNGTNCTWSIQPGSTALPPGIFLTNAGSEFALTGTPLDGGTYPFTVRCMASLGNPTRDMSITVY